MAFKTKLILLALFISQPLITARYAKAQIGRTETQLTPPVGEGILPASALNDGDITASVLFSKVIPFTIRYTIGLAVALAVLALVIGGYQFMTSYGDTEKRQKAQKTITYAILGLILAITAFGIVTIITSINIV